MRKSILYLAALGIMACSTIKPIVQDPIDFGALRRQLTMEYMADHYGIETTDPGIDPKMIVVHWTAIPNLQKSFEAFEHPTLGQSRGDISQGGQLNVSAHFLVDRDGTIYQLMPETLMARHVIGLNHCAIGIENVGGTRDTPLTKAQLKANIRLIRDLAARHDIQYVIGHYEYPLFENTPLWLEKDPGYRTQKTDPGPEFMAAIRNAFPPDQFKSLPDNKIP